MFKIYSLTSVKARNIFPVTVIYATVQAARPIFLCLKKENREKNLKMISVYVGDHGFSLALIVVMKLSA